MNVLHAERIPTPEPCPRAKGARRVAAEFATYLSDESRTAAESVEIIFFPETVADVSAALRECSEKGLSLTVAGARTGITGGAVPVEANAVLALEGLNHFNGVRYEQRRESFFAQVEAGVVLADFQEALHTTSPHELPWSDETSRRAGQQRLEETGKRLFYPVDPTETSAQIGGTVATDASGARTYFYGATRQWVEGLTVVLASGEVIRLRRGETTATDSEFVLRRTGSGVPEDKPLPVPNVRMPSTKHTAGYFLEPGMDAIDLFVGNEGTLGVITEVEVCLVLEPAERLFATAFLPDEKKALGLVRALRPAAEERLLALEYIGPKALDLLREKRTEQGASSDVPPLPEGTGCALYMEFRFDGDRQLRSLYDTLGPMLEKAGTSTRRCWAGFATRDLAEMKAMRHAIPEQVNSLIGMRKRDEPGLHKVGTDMAVPDEHLEEILSLYRNTLEESGLEYVIFGHVGDNHLHVNILPRNEREQEMAMDIYREFASEVVRMGGSVSAEHGIGRIKKEFLGIQFSSEELEAMHKLKRNLDPNGILNPGVLF